VKAGSGHFEFLQSLPSCLFCGWNDSVFLAVQTWCPFCSAHILLHENVKDDDAVAEKMQ